MSKLKRTVPSHILKLMYNSLILPHLNYGVTLWGQNMRRRIKLQKKAVRTMTKSKYNAHTSPLYKKENLLTINDIFKLKCLKFYYRHEHSELPAYFNSFFEQNTHQHDTRARHLIDPLPL